MTRDRITPEHLCRLVERLNTLTGQPPTPYTWTEDGVVHHNAGNYHLDGANGGWALDQIARGGGTTVVIARATKRGLYDQLRAYLDGVEAGRTTKGRTP